MLRSMSREVITSDKRLVKVRYKTFPNNTENIFTSIYNMITLKRRMPVSIKELTLQFVTRCRLKVFQNRILRRIFGSQRDANGEWRRLHNEELNNSYRSSDIAG